MSLLLGNTVRQRIATTLISLDESVQSRVSLNPETIAQYKEDIRSGIQFDPVVIYFDGSKYWLADGFHRTEASRQAGLAELNAEVYPGTRRDAILYSVSANGKHGLPRNNQDKRKSVVLLLSDTEWSRWSNVQIANRCIVSESFVRKVRSELTSHKTMLEQKAYANSIGVSPVVLEAALANIQTETGERIVQKGNTQYTLNTKKLSQNSGSRLQTPTRLNPIDTHSIEPPKGLSGTSSEPVALTKSPELSTNVIPFSKKISTLDPTLPREDSLASQNHFTQNLPQVFPGQLWQIGESHFLYCGAPDDLTFRQQLPTQIAMTLLFPRREADLRLDWIPASSLRKLVLFDPCFQDWDLQVFRDMLERTLDNCTSPQDPVVVLFLPDSALFLLMLAMECPCFCAEPDPKRCEAAIQAWASAATENYYSPAKLLYDPNQKTS
jgi:ParB-like nuclease domain